MDLLAGFPALRISRVRVALSSLPHTWPFLSSSSLGQAGRGQGRRHRAGRAGQAGQGGAGLCSSAVLDDNQQNAQAPSFPDGSFCSLHVGKLGWV